MEDEIEDNFCGKLKEKKALIFDLRSFGQSKVRNW